MHLLDLAVYATWLFTGYQFLRLVSILFTDGFRRPPTEAEERELEAACNAVWGFGPDGKLLEPTPRPPPDPAEGC